RSDRHLDYRAADRRDLEGSAVDDAEGPRPQPSARRAGPPGVPPPPPGAPPALPPGFGRGSGGAAAWTVVDGLNDGLSSLAVIRTTFETIDLFPEDGALRLELMPIIHDARQ